MTYIYEVTLPLGQLCREAHLDVVSYGATAKVYCTGREQREKFWAARFAYLKANPRAED